MKQTLLLLPLLFAIACSEPSGNDPAEEPATAIKEDVDAPVRTEVVPFQRDTLREAKNLNFYNDPYQLVVSRYSLNDSALRVETDSLIRVEHNNGIELRLTMRGDTVINRHFLKSDFAEVIDSARYEMTQLAHIRYLGVRTTTLFFEVGLRFPGEYGVQTLDLHCYYREKRNQPPRVYRRITADSIQVLDLN